VAPSFPGPHSRLGGSHFYWVQVTASSRANKIAVKESMAENRAKMTSEIETGNIISHGMSREEMRQFTVEQRDVRVRRRTTTATKTIANHRSCRVHGSAHHTSSRVWNWHVCTR